MPGWSSWAVTWASSRKRRRWRAEPAGVRSPPRSAWPKGDLHREAAPQPRGAEELEVDLVDQGRGLERVAVALSAEVTARDLAQLGHHARQQGGFGLASPAPQLPRSYWHHERSGQDFQVVNYWVE